MGNTGARLFVPPFMDPYEPNIDPILIQGASFIGQAMMNRLIGEGKTGITTNAVYNAPRWQVDAWISTYLAIAEGALEEVSGDVEALIGRPPLSLRAVLGQ